MMLNEAFCFFFSETEKEGWLMEVSESQIDRETGRSVVGIICVIASYWLSRGLTYTP